MTGMKLFVLKWNRVHCGIIFANRVESITFVQFLYQLNKI
jgi:hypothetical protein